MRTSTPLRYPGGKGKLTEFIKLIFVQNDLLGGQYLEPYAGGASIALSLLFHDYVTDIHLNDLNPAVFAFWNSAVNQTDELCKKIYDTQVTIEEWHRQKHVFKNHTEHSPLELGFATFFLNRTNRSGIILAGVIGGKNQTGAWKLDARFNKDDLIQRVERIGQFRNQIHLYNMDAKDLILDIIPTLSPKTLVYLDPPYYVKGSGLYQNHYTHDDHEEIANLVQKNIKQPWIVSYDSTVEIVGMYSKCPKIMYGLNYSAQTRYEGAEAMFFSKKLLVPDVGNPAKLKAS
mgnify:CR=1 FL=1